MWRILLLPFACTASFQGPWQHATCQLPGPGGYFPGLQSESSIILIKTFPEPIAGQEEYAETGERLSGYTGPRQSDACRPPNSSQPISGVETWDFWDGSAGEVVFTYTDFSILIDEEYWVLDGTVRVQSRDVSMVKRPKATLEVPVEDFDEIMSFDNEAFACCWE